MWEVTSEMTQHTEEKKSDIVVFWVRRDTACADCGEEHLSDSLVQSPKESLDASTAPTSAISFICHEATRP